MEKEVVDRHFPTFADHRMYRTRVVKFQLLDTICGKLKSPASELYYALMTCRHYGYVSIDQLFYRLNRDSILAQQNVVDGTYKTQQEILRTHHWLFNAHGAFEDYSSYATTITLARCIPLCYTKDPEQQALFREQWAIYQQDVADAAARNRLPAGEHEPKVPLLTEESGIHIPDYIQSFGAAVYKGPIVPSEAVEGIEPARLWKPRSPDARFRKGGFSKDASGDDERTADSEITQEFGESSHRHRNVEAPLRQQNTGAPTRQQDVEPNQHPNLLREPQPDILESAQAGGKIGTPRAVPNRSISSTEHTQVASTPAPSLVAGTKRKIEQVSGVNSRPVSPQIPSSPATVTGEFTFHASQMSTPTARANTGTPSGQHDSFARVGVLEGMSSLDVPPSSRVKAKALALTDPGSRRISGFAALDAPTVSTSSNPRRVSGFTEVPPPTDPTVSNDLPPRRTSGSTHLDFPIMSANPNTRATTTSTGTTTRNAASESRGRRFETCVESSSNVSEDPISRRATGPSATTVTPVPNSLPPRGAGGRFQKKAGGRSDKKKDSKKRVESDSGASLTKEKSQKDWKELSDSETERPKKKQKTGRGTRKSTVEDTEEDSEGVPITEDSEDEWVP